MEKRDGILKQVQDMASDKRWCEIFITNQLGWDVITPEEADEIWYLVFGDTFNG